MAQTLSRSSNLARPHRTGVSSLGWVGELALVGLGMVALLVAGLRGRRTTR